MVPMFVMLGARGASLRDHQRRRAACRRAGSSSAYLTWTAVSSIVFLLFYLKSDIHGRQRTRARRAHLAKRQVSENLLLSPY